MVTDQKIVVTAPTHLWVGPHEKIIHQVIQSLQQFFCKQEACGTCSVCQQIISKQHHAVRWYMPEKQYKVEQIDEILHTTSFALAQEQSFFCIIQKAELLTHVCANRLLKLLEEPPKGYYFILIAEHEDLLLETIRSRCVTTRFFDTVSDDIYKELYSCFTHVYKTISPTAFLKIIERMSIDEHQTKSLVEQIVTFWNEKRRMALIQDDALLYKSVLSFLSILEKQIQKLPLAGSSRLFWLNLYAQTH